MLYKGDVNIFIYNIVTYACIVYTIYSRISYIYPTLYIDRFTSYIIELYIIYSCIDLHHLSFPFFPPASPSSPAHSPSSWQPLSLYYYTNTYVFVVCVHVFSKLTFQHWKINRRGSSQRDINYLYPSSHELPVVFCLWMGTSEMFLCAHKMFINSVIYPVVMQAFLSLTAS